MKMSVRVADPTILLDCRRIAIDLNQTICDPSSVRRRLAELNASGRLTSRAGRFSGPAAPLRSLTRILIRSDNDLDSGDERYGSFEPGVLEHVASRGFFLEK